MRRRQFLALLGSMAIGCPADVVAQKPDRVRRIGVLMPLTADSALGQRVAKICTQAPIAILPSSAKNCRRLIASPAVQDRATSGSNLTFGTASPLPNLLIWLNVVGIGMSDFHH